MDSAERSLVGNGGHRCASRLSQLIIGDMYSVVLRSKW